jgi:amino acid transporter
MNRLGIPILPSLVNAVILISIFSTTNSFVFAASRSLYGMAQQGQAPRVFARLNKQGVPYLCVLITLAMGCLAYLSLSQGTVKVLNWWINLVTSAQLVSWTCIAITFLRFFYASTRQGRRSDLPQLGSLQPFSAYTLLVCSPLVFLFQGYYVFLPGAFNGPDFVFAYGSIFIFLAILAGYKVYWGIFRRLPLRFWVPLDQVDLVSDLDKIESMTRKEEEKRMATHRTLGEKIEDILF